MEPMRDPAIDLMNWEGWHFLSKGIPPQEGQGCLLRIKQLAPGLVPVLTIVEVPAVYTCGRWEDGKGGRLADVRAVIAWRPASPIAGRK